MTESRTTAAECCMGMIRVSASALLLSACVNVEQMEGGMTELLTWVPYKQGTSYFVKPEGM